MLNNGELDAFHLNDDIRDDGAGPEDPRQSEDNGFSDTDDIDTTFRSIKPGISQPDAFLTSISVLFSDGTLSNSTRITGCFDGVVTVPIEGISSIQFNHHQVDIERPIVYLQSRNNRNSAYNLQTSMTTEPVQIDHGYFIRTTTFSNMRRGKAFHTACWDLLEAYRQHNPMLDNIALYKWITELYEEPMQFMRQDRYFGDLRIGGPVIVNQMREWTLREGDEWLLADPTRVPKSILEFKQHGSGYIPEHNFSMISASEIPPNPKSLDRLSHDVIAVIAASFLQGGDVYRLATCSKRYWNIIMTSGSLSNMIWKSQCQIRHWMLPTDAHSLTSSPFNWRAGFELCEYSRSMRNRWRIHRILQAWQHDMTQFSSVSSSS